ncbi:probable aminopeptidase NPEPL1 [Anthonomus grandis grandis]|uniref:probable aminopeptidase NPEPL1 n=1 Tax=Anthonomus grandis grandis TaxID=2921223 RepID=UPI002165FE8D|nr:probable aminopeptidase NPEPL1 [Anthonomus grandis grandis]XP_050294720.1 probable aminopeptidase NPEPL1 [Anthonomus grandis grandis]XP_050294721.1 probable aminopeptidase NPEPL1 [Anthonomus grandis grandis]
MAKLVFRSGLSKTDPQLNPVLIVGQLKHLNQLRFTDIRAKLEPRVNEETFKLAVTNLHPSPTDTSSLWLNSATVAALPVKCSRHNTPSRAHSITKIVQSALTDSPNESIVMVCEKPDVFASACAIARAFPLYTKKSQSEDSKPTVSVEFVIVPHGANSHLQDNSQLTENELKCLEYAVDGVRLAAKIVDAPCNEMNVDNFLEEVKAVGSSLNITPTIIRGEELQKKGFGGIYGVGKAAKVPPALAVLSYTPEGATQTIAWVGKGIVYDTGGLCIKGKTAMTGMKRDCGGAAGILGAFYTAVKSGFSENLHAVFCLAENAVGPDATRPDDIHTLYSGRSVEINNTDAEGRLVLADGVVYANKDLKANIILDMATLTGAQGIATGKYHAAVLTNNGNWEDIVVKAGLTSGDLTFPLPYCPELHFPEFTSALADMKNSVGDRSNAQASCAGLFVAAHLGFDYPGTWVHVDMAYPVHSGERATGYGVSLLNTLFGSYSKQPLLKSIAPDLSGACECSAKKQRTA